ncbi:MAG: peptidylprolyl isomerase [candidate division Zixibacteria bacterium]|nr:peptidylprolyl isomerase [candidate division Zixibacteria bacterium]
MIRKNTLVPFSIAVVLFGSVACSQQEGEKKTEGGELEASSSVSASVVADSLKGAVQSLADKRFAVRDEGNPLVTLETDFGKMTLELYRDVAPAHADSFVARTREGFYNGTIFHRVIDNFMIQGGDPQGNGTGGAEYFLKAEFNELPHQEGTLSMARSRDPNSASSQFFVCLARNRSTQSLDGQYTVFGQLIKGYDVLHDIGSVECMANPGNPREISKPKVDVKLIRAYISDAEGNPL